MIENYKSSNGFTAPHPTETVTSTAPTFDVMARRTARMVVPLSPDAIEDALSEITQIKAAPVYQDTTADYATDSQPKTILYLKYLFTAALTVFVLGMGAVGGFALAQYRNIKEKPAAALIPQPALTQIKSLPRLTLEVFEDPDEYSEVTDDATEDDADVDDDRQSEPKPSRIPNKRPMQENQKEQPQPLDDNQQQSPPQEQRERRVRKPKPEDNSNINGNRQKQTQTESVFQKIKRAIEKLGQN